MLIRRSTARRQHRRNDALGRPLLEPGHVGEPCIARSECAQDSMVPAAPAPFCSKKPQTEASLSGGGGRRGRVLFPVRAAFRPAGARSPAGAIRPCPRRRNRPAAALARRRARRHRRRRRDWRRCDRSAHGNACPAPPPAGRPAICNRRGSPRAGPCARRADRARRSCMSISLRRRSIAARRQSRYCSNVIGALPAGMLSALASPAGGAGSAGMAGRAIDRADSDDASGENHRSHPGSSRHFRILVE